MNYISDVVLYAGAVTAMSCQALSQAGGKKAAQAKVEATMLNYRLLCSPLHAF